MIRVPTKHHYPRVSPLINIDTDRCYNRCDRNAVEKAEMMKVDNPSMRFNELQWMKSAKPWRSYPRERRPSENQGRSR